MPLDIPQEQLERVQPIVDDLSAAVRRLSSDMPMDTESALVFLPDGGPRT